MKPERIYDATTPAGLLRGWRERHAINRREGAVRLGVPLRTLEMWERGRTPHRETWRRVFAVVGMPEDFERKTKKVVDRTTRRA